MGKKRLTWWERRIRERAIPHSEWLSVVALILLATWYGHDDALMRECAGIGPEQFQGRRACGIRIALGLPCSSLLVFDGFVGWLKLAPLFVTLVWFSGFLWLQRERRRYWRPRQKREAELARKRRAKRRQEKTRAADSPTPSSRT